MALFKFGGLKIIHQTAKLKTPPIILQIRFANNPPRHFCIISPNITLANIFSYSYAWYLTVQLQTVNKLCMNACVGKGIQKNFTNSNYTPYPWTIPRGTV